MVVSFLTLFVNKYTTCALFTKQPLFACNLTSKMIKYHGKKFIQQIGYNVKEYI